MNNNSIYQRMKDAGYFQHAFNIINSPDTHYVFFDDEDNIISVHQDSNNNCPIFWEFDLARYTEGMYAKNLPGFKTSEQRWLYYQRLLRLKRSKECTTK